MTQVDAFRYRIEDALRAVTGANVRDAHLKDIKHEILNSEKLKVFFKLCNTSLILKIAQRILKHSDMTNLFIHLAFSIN